MAGIWNRVVERGELGDPLGSATIVAAVYLVTRGIFTATQVRDALNGKVQNPLTVQELADLNTILTNASTGSATAKLDYMLRIESLLIAAEEGFLVNEATFRSEAGLP